MGYFKQQSQEKNSNFDNVKLYLKACKGVKLLHHKNAIIIKQIIWKCLQDDYSLCDKEYNTRL